MRYEGDIYRPPSEANSYLLQATVGCSHNACTFCGMFKNKNYYNRNLQDVLEDIDMAKKAHGDIRTAFLCDGDALNLPTEDLLTILEKLYHTFPNLTRVSTYAGPRNIKRKTPEELRKICAAGLQRVYLGIETGDGEILLKRGKGVDAEGMLQAGLTLNESGFEIWGIIMVGLAGGGDAFIQNATMTADMINKMAPKYLSAMTYMPVPGTPMHEEIQQGKFTVQSPFESLQETKLLIYKIDTKGMFFTSNHASNYVPIEGKLSEDKEKLLALLNKIIKEQDTSKMRRTNQRGL